MLSTFIDNWKGGCFNQSSSTSDLGREVLQWQLSEPGADGWQGSEAVQFMQDNYSDLSSLLSSSNLKLMGRVK